MPIRPLNPDLRVKTGFKWSIRVTEPLDTAQRKLEFEDCKNTLHANF
jgi:hypothetical protein